MKNFLICLLSVIIICVSFGICPADEVVEMEAELPRESGYELNVYKVSGQEWEKAEGLAFDDLVFDEENQIIKSEYYYVVEVEVQSNAEAWTLVHNVRSISNKNANLDNNINVVFHKQESSEKGSLLEKLSFAESNNKSFSRNTLLGGWLRIYYSIATGDENDASGVVPLTSNMPAGNYSGGVDITLTE